MHDQPYTQHAAPVPPPRPSAPPPSSLAAWMDAPRSAPLPGLEKLGYQPPKESSGKKAEGKGAVKGVVISAALFWLGWSLWRNGYVPYWEIPIRLFTPDDWWYAASVSPKPDGRGFEALSLYGGLVFCGMLWTAARLGHWRAFCERYLGPLPVAARLAAAAVAILIAELLVWHDQVPIQDPLVSLLILLGGINLFTSWTFVYVFYALTGTTVALPFLTAAGFPPRDLWTLVRTRTLPTTAAPGKRPSPASEAAAPPPPAPSLWPELRAIGQDAAAEALTDEVASGRAGDVDVARIREHIRRTAPHHRDEITPELRRRGAAAWTHPSGARDLPTRTAHHDLLTGQVRIGRILDDDHNDPAARGNHLALDASLLATSLLAIGPSGSGKTRHVVAPVAESLALNALAGRAALLTVCAAGAPVGPTNAYDLIVRPGDSRPLHGLDLYADTADPDEAAGLLAEALVADIEGTDTRRAATALAQLLGPYRCAHGRFPTVSELCELLRADPAALADLEADLAASTDGTRPAMQRELQTRMRQFATAGDPATALAERLALLDRPLFADAFTTGQGPAPFSLHSLAHHPMRVRIELPGRPHEEAGRILARLLFAQFAAIAAAPGREHFLGLVLDDATHTITPDSLRALQHLRTLNAGVLLGLRTINDVPERLHGALHSAVGCRAALAGVTTWDGREFSAAWGTTWVESKEVAQHTVYAQAPVTRALHALRKMVTGQAVTTDAVTVRKLEREHWSASELARDLPPGHAVISVTDRTGTRSTPYLIQLGR